MNVQDRIQHAWNESKCPLVNGVVFDSGQVCQLRIRVLQIRQTWVEWLEPAGRMDLQEYLAQHGDSWVECTPLAEAACAALGVQIVCGGGPLGADGFCAACRAADRHLLWLAFFQDSNPFEYVEVHEDAAFVVNNSQNVWRIPLTRPELASIVK